MYLDKVVNLEVFQLVFVLFVFSFLWLAENKRKLNKQGIYMYHVDCAETTKSFISSAVARPNGQPRQAGVARGVREHAPPEKF